MSVGDVTQALPPAFSESRIPKRALALLVHEGGALHCPIMAETVHIGRYDPVTGSQPDIDLAKVDIRRSVSRRHARIVFAGGSFLLTEEAGVLNGTFINGRRLTPGESAPLQSCDKLGFGTITFLFKLFPKSGTHSR